MLAPPPAAAAAAELKDELEETTAEKEDVEDECKRLRTALMQEKERATVKMSGWMQVHPLPV